MKRILRSILLMVGAGTIVYWIGSNYFPKLGASLQSITGDKQNNYGRLNVLNPSLSQPLYKLIGNSKISDSYVTHSKDNFAIVEVTAKDHKVPWVQGNNPGKVFGHQITIYGVNGGRKPFVEIEELTWGKEGIIPQLEPRRITPEKFRLVQPDT